MLGFGLSFNTLFSTSKTIKPLAIITEEFRPSKKGGIATWAHGIANYLGEQDQYDVTVLVKKRGGLIANEIPRDLPYRLVFMYGRDWSKFKKWYVSFYCKKYIKSSNNPIIISATWELSEGLIKHKKKYSFSLITVLHGLEVTRLNSNKYDKSIPKFIQTIDHSDQVIAVSNYTKNEAISITGTQKITTIPNFVNTTEFFPQSISECRNKFQLHHSDKILLSLSRLVKRKGHDIVIRAIQIVKKKIPGIKYLIAGSGDFPYEKMLKKLVNDLGLQSHVHFLGYIEENKKPLLYNASDVYIMNSLDTDEQGDSEGFGITFLEANACGKPVIGTNVGGISDAIENNVNGILVKPNDANATAEAIIQLFSDQSLYQKLSGNGISRVNNQFSLSNVGGKYHQIISSLSPSY